LSSGPPSRHALQSVSRRHPIPAFGWRTGMRRQGRLRRSNTPGSRPKRIARLARSAIPQSRSAASRRRSVRASRPDPHMALFTEAARPTTMLYVLSMPRRQRSRETKRQYFPPCGTLVAPSIAFDGWLRSRIRRGRQILPSFATTVGAFARPEVSGWPRLTSAVCGEYARKLLRVRRFRWSQACSLGTVNPSRKLRTFESFTCHHVLKGPLTCGNAGCRPFRVVRL